MHSLLALLTLLAALGSGLIAGVFFAFSSFVMPALGRIAPSQGIAAMQAINVVVLNPTFLGVFMGTAAACLMLSIKAALTWSEPGAALLLGGSVLYLVGTFLVTVAFNVPRNDALAAVRADSAEGASYWARYLVEWSTWNHVRSAAALGAATLLTLAFARRLPANLLGGGVLAAFSIGDP